jgi:asparagine synthase (glutamine-hydrolysing)
VSVLRGAYIALCGPAEADAVRAAIQRIEAVPGWRRAADLRHLTVWTLEAAPLPVQALPDGAGVIVGDLFEPPDAVQPWPAPGSGPANARAWAGWLVRHRWGRYVALLRDPHRAPAVLRDPSGDLEALTWPLGPGTHMVVSDLRRLPRDLRPPRQALDWDAIAAYMASPANGATASLFGGMAVVAPGELRPLDGPQAGELVWRPTDHRPDPHADPRDLARDLVCAVDYSVETLAGRYARFDVEVSGGLDSAIVATSLRVSGQEAKAAHWVNRAVRRASGDERAYAQVLADRLGVALTLTLKPIVPLTVADLQALAQGAWSGMDGVEAARDRADAARLAHGGAQALFTGQGGDAVFFQPPTALVLADAWRAHGPAVLATPLLAETARRTRQSVWAALRAARRPQDDGQILGLVSREAADLAAARPHPWVRDAEAAGAPPAKRRHVQLIANHHVFHGDSRAGRLADIVHPLLAQPVVERALRVPVPDLVRGGGDRPFARAAFAARLPTEILSRRGKGAQGAHFAQLIAASLSELRPFLLEGNLAAAGVLDRAELERRLDPADLIARPGAAQLLWAASMEAWVRYWQTQVADVRGSTRWNR